MNIAFPEYIKTWKHNSSTNIDTMRQIIMIHPYVVVDCGAGDGFYGKLIRYCFPDANIIAVEKTTEYIKKFNLNLIYDDVLNRDLVDAVKELSGDLVIFGDVLEHLQKDMVRPVLDDAVNNFKFVLINGPVGFQPQEHPNPNEIHRSGLDYSDFRSFRVLEYHSFCENKMFNCLLCGSKK